MKIFFFFFQSPSDTKKTIKEIKKSEDKKSLSLKVEKVNAETQCENTSTASNSTPLRVEELHTQLESLKKEVFRLHNEHNQLETEVRTRASSVAFLDNQSKFEGNKKVL